MAALALFAAGSAIGSAVGGSAALFGGILGATFTAATLGGIIGGALGGIIDSQFIMPAIFGRGAGGAYTGPRIDDFRVQSASEGTPLKLCFGPENRIAGTLIYMSDLIEEARTESVGGGKGGGVGGGGGAEVTNYYYYLHAAIAVCEGPIAAIKKVWADAKLIFDDTHREPMLSTSSVATLINLNNPKRKGEYTLSLTGSVAEYVVGSLASGRKITVSGFTNPTNNGEKTVRSVSGSGASLTIQIAEACVNETAVADVTITIPPVKDARYEDITVHLGTDDQMPDAFHQTLTGADDTPAYRNRAYVMIKKLALKDFGNRFPQMTFLVAAQEHLTTAECIKKIVQRRGGSPPVNPWEVRGVVRGYSSAEPMSGIELLEPLILAQNLNATDSGGTLYFFNRSREHQVRLPSADLVARDIGDNPPPRVIEFRDGAGYEVPSEVNVTFIESASDYQQGNQSERRINFTQRNIVSVQLPLVMSAAEARAVANRILWSSWTERAEASISTTPDHLELEDGDIVIAQDVDGEDVYIRVDQLDFGKNGLILVRGAVVEPQTYRNVSNSDAPVAGGGSTPYIPPEITLAFMDLPPLRDQEAETPGFYYAMCATESTAEFRGALGYVSEDDVTYLSYFASSSEGVIGAADTILANGAYGYWDLENTLDVTILEGELTSESAEDVIRGANRLLVGTEIIAFREAELLAPGQYRLSKLLRGLRDTKSSMATHGANETVVLLTSTSIGFRQIQTAQISAPRYYKPVGTSGNLSIAEAQTETSNALTLRQFAPCNLEASRDMSSNLTLEWVRRSRAVVKVFGGPFPVLFDREEYELDFLSGSTVLRTVTVTGATTYTYTATDQTTDYGSPPAPGGVKVRIYQIGPTGRGNVLEELV